MTRSAPQRDHFPSRQHGSRLLLMRLVALGGLTLPLVASAQTPAETEMRRLYNQACSAAQLGDRTTAENLLQQVIENGIQHQLVADAHYNLGWLDLQQLRNQLHTQQTPTQTLPSLQSSPTTDASQAPQAAPASPTPPSIPTPQPARNQTSSGPTLAPETDRLAELEQLVDAAEQHFRAALQIQPNHLPARQNLEIARLWVTRHKQLADQAARRSRHESQQGAVFLLWMIENQTTLLAQAIQLDRQPDSFSRRRQVRELQVQQRQLRDDGTFLEVKLGEALSETAARSTGNPPQPEQAEPATAAGQKQPVPPMSATSSSAREPHAAQGANAGGTTILSGQANLPKAVVLELTRARQALDAAAQSPSYELMPLIPRQMDVLASVQRLFVQVATFDALLSRALALQARLEDQVAELGQAGSASPRLNNESNGNSTSVVPHSTTASRTSPGGELSSNMTGTVAGESHSLPASDRATPAAVSGQATASAVSPGSSDKRSGGAVQVGVRFNAKSGAMSLLSLQQAHIAELAAALRTRATTELHAAQPANLAEQLDQALEGPPTAQPPAVPTPQATPPRESGPDSKTPGISPPQGDATPDDPATKRPPAANRSDEDPSTDEVPTASRTVKTWPNVGPREARITTLEAAPRSPAATVPFQRAVFARSSRPIRFTNTADSILVVRQPTFGSQPVGWSDESATRGSSPSLSGPAAAGREPSEPDRFPLGLDWGRDALRSRRKAIELTPQIEALAQQASSRLSAQQPLEARPLQHEARQLLQEIAAESTPDGGAPSDSNPPSNSTGKARDSSANRSQPDPSSNANSSTDSPTAEANAPDKRTGNSPSQEKPSDADRPDADRPDANPAQDAAADSSPQRESRSNTDAKPSDSMPNEPQSNPSDQPPSRQPASDRSDAKTTPPQKQSAEHRDSPPEDHPPSESSSQLEWPPESKQPKKSSPGKASSATPQPAHSGSKDAASGEPSTLADQANSILTEQEQAALEQAQRQVEILFDKVRQREREQRERQEKLQRILRSRVRVEKDW
jgi:hypothetical protein